MIVLKPARLSAFLVDLFPCLKQPDNVMRDVAMGVDLAAITERSGTLEERMKEAMVFDPLGEPDRAEERINAWKRIVSKEDDRAFERRLRWDGMSLADARAAVSPVRFAKGRPMPKWTETLRCCVHSIERAGKTREKQITKTPRRRGTLPFEELLQPLVTVAWEQFHANRSDGHTRLSEAARRSLEEELLRRLSKLAAPILQNQFIDYRSTHRPRYLFSEILGARRASCGDDTQLYDSFIGLMLSGGMINLFEEYSVLARLLSVIVDQWVEGLLEFLHRLVRDEDVLSKEFLNGRPLGIIEAIQAGISDPHRGGRSSLILMFSSGLRLVYKPRSLGMERAFFDLLQWLNDQGFSEPYRVLHVVDRDAYGWMAFAEHASCSSVEEVKRYYFQCGALLCLVYGLGGIDFHFENVVAVGAHPVLIDLETVMQPRLLNQYQSPQKLRADAFQSVFNGSVLGTGLLPVWQVGPSGKCFDPSGFTSQEGQESSWRVSTWKWINTDDMSLIWEEVPVRPRHNMPMLCGESCAPGQHVATFIDGFRQQYRFLMAHRDALLAPEGPMASFCNKPVRFIFRPSAAYGRMLERSLQPACLREGVQRSLQLELTARAFLQYGDASMLWPIQQEERQAMEQLDIPLFTVRANDRSMALTTGLIQECFAETAYDRAINRLQGFSEKDLRRQVHLIQTSFGLRYPLSMSVERNAIEDNAENRNQLGSEALVREAKALAEKMLDLAFSKESLFWGIVKPLRGEKKHLQPSGLDLPHGNTGIALFLAALAWISDDAVYRKQALKALLPVSGRLFKKNPEVSKNGMAAPERNGGWGNQKVFNAIHSIIWLTEEQEAMQLLEGLDYYFGKETSGKSASDGVKRFRKSRTERRIELLDPMTDDVKEDLRIISTCLARFDKDVTPEVLPALERICRVDCSRADHLCGGNFGLVDVLLEAGRRLGRPDLVAEAHRRAAWSVRRAHYTGSYKFHSALPCSVYNPGFYFGVSGIGYVLLRLAFPHMLPSILLEERRLTEE
ncbi:type 2 lanthipeptide synthetase LanM [Rhodocaloribacter sp.]